MDLIAKILLEIVFEQAGGDPHGLIDVAFDIWAKLHLLDDAGMLLEEALALAYLFEPGWEEDAWSWARIISRHRTSREWFNRRQWHGFRREHLLSTFEERKMVLLHSPSDYGEAARGLERLTEFAQCMSEERRTRGRNHLLLAAGALALDELEFLSSSYAELERRVKKPPYELNRDQRFRELVTSPADFIGRSLDTGGPPFFFEEHDPVTLASHLHVPEEYHPVISSRFAAYLGDKEEETLDVFDMFEFDVSMAPRPAEEADFLMFLMAPMCFELTPEFITTHGSLAYFLLVTMTFRQLDPGAFETEEAMEERVQLLEWLRTLAAGRAEWDTALTKFEFHAAALLMHKTSYKFGDFMGDRKSSEAHRKAAACQLDGMRDLHQQVASPPFIRSIREETLRRLQV